MNFLILGDGPEELAWAEAIVASDSHRPRAAYPGAPGFAMSRDLDDALATSGVEAVVVGGPPEWRAEALRRVASAGLSAICLHPPGPDSEAYYLVSMSRAETGAVIVPDLSARLHPGVDAIREAMEREEFGTFRGLRYESPVGPEGGDLVRFEFARAVDLVRSLVGEIGAVTATGEPPGEDPSQSLVVHLRGEGPRRAEVRLWAGPPEPARLVLIGASGTLTLEFRPEDLGDEARLIRRRVGAPEDVTPLPQWDRHAAILSVLTAAVSGAESHPDLADGTRAMEVSEGVARSLRRGRTVELHYEEISEAGTFKSVMTSVGCLVLIAALVVLPVALAGPALGFNGTIYMAYAIPPVLFGFVTVQLLRFAIREPRAAKASGEP